MTECADLAAAPSVAFHWMTKARHKRPHKLLDPDC